MRLHSNLEVGERVVELLQRRLDLKGAWARVNARVRAGAEARARARLTARVRVRSGSTSSS